MNKSSLGRVIVFGASGSIGSEIVHYLARAGYQIIAIGRDPDKLEMLPAEPFILDLETANQHTSPVLPGDIVISATYLRYTEKVSRLCPPDISNLIVIGSTRHKTRLPDPISDEVHDAMDYLSDVNLPWVILHPTLIYGCSIDDQEYNNTSSTGMQRIKALVSSYPVIPLPNFGRALIQPIHIHDVSQAILQAIDNPKALHMNIDIAGPHAMPLKELLSRIADSLDKRIWIFPMPTFLMFLLAWLARTLKS